MPRIHKCLIGVLALALMAGATLARDIHTAIASGNIDLVRELMTADPAQLNSANEQGMTPIRMAVHSMQTDIANLLLEKGARTDDLHPAFGTLINHAFVITCQNSGGPELAALLVDHGLAFDASKIDGMGMTPLDWATHFGNVPMAQLALEHGANANLLSQRLGRPPLVAAVSKGVDGLVSLLLEHGADVSIADNTDRPPIFYAVSKGRAAILEKLLAHGATTDFVEPHYGRSLLHLAAINGFLDITTALVTHGSNINVVDKLGRTAQFYAAKYGNKKVAEYLAEQGAAPPRDMVENYGYSPRLNKNHNPGEATLWYLNNRGWTVKTRNHLLVFDAEEFDVRRSDDPCLANGFLTAGELKNQSVVGVYSCYHGRPGEPAYIHTLADSLENLAFVHLVEDAWRGSVNTTYLKGEEDTAAADIRIQTIDIADYMPMLAYLCHVDSLTIYYQAFATDDPDSLKQRYEFLGQFVDTVDVAFLPLPEPEQEIRDIQLFLERFPTRAILLLDPNRREHLFHDAARLIADWGYPTEVLCAENPGDCFTYDYTDR